MFIFINELIFALSYVTLIFVFLLCVWSFCKWLKPIKDKSVNQDEIDDFTQDKFELLNYTFLNIMHLLVHQKKVMETETQRAHSLIQDAALGLSNSFKLLQSLSSQQHMLITLMSKEHQMVDDKKSVIYQKVNEALNELAGIAPQIENAVNVGIRSLQFEDLTSQVLMGLQNNFDDIHELNGYFDTFSLHQKKWEQQLSIIGEECRRITKASQKMNENRSVIQSTMNEGEIDLF